MHQSSSSNQTSSNMLAKNQIEFKNIPTRLYSHSFTPECSWFIFSWNHNPSDFNGHGMISGRRPTAPYPLWKAPFFQVLLSTHPPSVSTFGFVKFRSLLLKLLNFLLQKFCCWLCLVVGRAQWAKISSWIASGRWFLPSPKVGCHGNRLELLRMWVFLCVIVGFVLLVDDPVVCYLDIWIFLLLFYFFGNFRSRIILPA